MNSPAPTSDRPQALISIGERLRQRRLERGLSVADLASKLKMGQEQLLALESADLDRLPEAVFVIAQIRRVASSLGVDVEALIQELRQSDALSRRSMAAGESPLAGDPGATPNPLPSQRSWLMLLVAVVAVPVLGWLGISGWQRWQPAAEQPSTPKRIADPLADPLADPKQADAGKAPASQSATSASANPDQLTLTSADTSWLAVRSSKGIMLFEGNFQGEKAFPIGDGLSVLAGRPDLVKASLAGSTPQALGPIEAVRWRSFKPPQQP